MPAWRTVPRPSAPTSARRRPERPAAVAALLLAACTACWASSHALLEGLSAFALASGSRRRLGVRPTSTVGHPPRSIGLSQLRAFEDEDYGDGDWTTRMRIEDLQVGQELKGIVNSVAPFGCFVDVGAERDGLVHISRASTGFVENMESIAQPGQSVTVWVVEVTDGKLGLTMVENKDRDAVNTADLAPFQLVKPEEWLEGTVTHITDFGLFCAVTPPSGGLPAQGLVHISQIKDGFVDHPAMEVEVGQKVRVRVKDAVPDTGRLRLTMREPASVLRLSPESQDLTGFKGLGPTTWLKGRVSHSAPFGVFVEVTAPGDDVAVQGMVHITEIRDGFVDDPSAEVEANQEVEVRVINVDDVTGRLSLSMKPQAVGADPAA